MVDRPSLLKEPPAHRLPTHEEILDVDVEDARFPIEPGRVECHADFLEESRKYPCSFVPFLIVLKHLFE